MEFIQELFCDTSATNLIGYLQIILKIALSFFAGFILGLERKIRQQSVGVRTIIVICVASTLLMMVSLNIGDNHGGDPGRIAAQVISGIGFLGGGAILRHGLNIRGLTSAATIWTASAIGLGIGAGMYTASLLVLIVCILSLILLDKFEAKYFPAGRTKRLILIFRNNKIDLPLLKDTVEESGLIVLNMDIAKNLTEKHMEITFYIRTPGGTDILALTDKIKKLGNLEEINLSD